MEGLSLLMKWEDEGLDSYEEALALADYIESTGLHHSAGRYGRFLASVREDQAQQSQ